MLLRGDWLYLLEWDGPLRRGPKTGGSMSEIASGDGSEQKFAASDRIVAWAGSDPIDNAYFTLRSVDADGKNPFDYGSQRGSLRVAVALGNVWVSRWVAGAATDRNEVVRYGLNELSGSVIPENLSEAEASRQAHLAGSDQQAVWCRTLPDGTSVLYRLGADGAVRRRVNPRACSYLWLSRTSSRVYIGAADGPTICLYRVLDDESSSDLLCTDHAFESLVELADQTLAFVDDRSTVMRRHEDGTTEVLFETAQPLFALAADDTNVYYLTATNVGRFRWAH
jgi:hypothetical protein